MKKALILIGIYILLFDHTPPLYADAVRVLTKEDAWKILKSNGYQWKQTDLIILDAQAKSEQAESAFWPHIRLTLREYGTQVNPAQYGIQNVPVTAFIAGSSTLELGYNIFDQEAIERLRAAEANERIGKASTEQLQNDLTYLMVIQFLNVQRLKKKIEVVDMNMQRDSEILKIAETRVKEGLGTRLDLMRARGLYEADNLKKLDSTIAYDKAAQELANLLGQVQLEAEPGPILYKEFRGQLKDPSPVKQERPDLVAAQATIEAANALKSSAVGENYPKISLFADAGFLGVPSVFGIAGPMTGAVGVQVSMPIFSGGLISGRIKEQSVKVIQAEYHQKSLELESQTQLNLALSHIKEAQMAVNVSQDQIQIAEEELKLTRQKYGAGSGTGFELSNSQVSYAKALDDHVEAVFNHELAKVTYYRAIGDFKEYFKEDLEPPVTSSDAKPSTMSPELSKPPAAVEVPVKDTSRNSVLPQTH